MSWKGIYSHAVQSAELRNTNLNSITALRLLAVSVLLFLQVLYLSTFFQTSYSSASNTDILHTFISSVSFVNAFRSGDGAVVSVIPAIMSIFGYRHMIVGVLGCDIL